MRTKRKSGFTLVEILIVVVILGILAAIVIPQFSEASDNAKAAALDSTLQTVRSQISLYRFKESGDPDCTSAATMATDMVPAYLQSIPDNPYTGTGTVLQGAGAALEDAASDWWYNTTDHTFWTNDVVANR